ncbi:MAG: hypothetical protein ACI8Y4_003408 [Candidatus Poriferisodalaceae bacterium]|jgi:hypothetical protein
MDAADPLEVGPIRLITEPDLSPNNRDNPTHTAGATFVGQFLDHDITMDAGSTLGRPTSVARSTNLRTARFDLDSVYGGGPDTMPELYISGDRYKFRVESGGLFEDVPRSGDETAVIADPRNDENLIISRLQAAMLKFHNAVLDQVRAGRLRDQAAFDEARRLVRWHWQWLIVHEFLPQFVGQAMVDDVLRNGLTIESAGPARIPVEFQTSAYRFGHSMIRPSYRANLAGDNGEPFFGFVFDRSQYGRPDPDDLNGRSRAARRFIGWQTFFDFGDGEVKPNKRIDTKISTPLFQLPLIAIDATRGADVGPIALATRNLQRHVTWGIPSGQRVAREMGVDRLSRGDLDDLDGLGHRLDQSTPLWFYILREADVIHEGLHLGPVGGRIVAEVFVNLLRRDPTSYFSSQPEWRPELESRSGDGDFSMTDLLTIAQVDPASRGQ